MPELIFRVWKFCSAMRLSSTQQHHMQAVFQTHLPAGARVWLFGSRANNAARGGDIDLLVQLPVHETKPLAFVRRLRIALQRYLGERKIDILLQTPDNDSAMQQIAQAEGVLLWTSDNANSSTSTNSSP
jgi:predicted nucleotidyltransferase